MVTTYEDSDFAETLRVLSTAVQHVGRLRASTIDTFAAEQDKRRRVFDELVRCVAPAIPAIAEIRVPDEGGDFYYFAIDERKDKIWYVAWRSVHPEAPAASWIAFTPVGAGADVQPEPIPPTPEALAESLRTIRLDEFVRRTASRLRVVAKRMEARRDESLRLARALEAVATLLGAILEA